MSEDALPFDRILTAAEVVLRRHGAEKTNVVDVARVLGISHSQIYRHFPSKKALLDAVAARWLHVITSPLAAIAEDHGRPASERLVAWFDTLRAAKQRKVLDDPELFEVYHRLAVAARDLATEHVATLLGQVTMIIEDGIKSEEFSSRLDAKVAAKACLQATSAFHHPAMLSQGHVPEEAEAKAVLELLLAGLKAGAGEV